MRRALRTGRGGPPGDNPADEAVVSGTDVGGQAGRGPDSQGGERRPGRRSASRIRDAAISTPSTESGKV